MKKKEREENLFQLKSIINNPTINLTTKSEKCEKFFIELKKKTENFVFLALKS